MAAEINDEITPSSDPVTKMNPLSAPRQLVFTTSSLRTAEGAEPVHRTILSDGGNRPEARQQGIVTALRAVGADVEEIVPAAGRYSALSEVVRLGVLSPDLLDLIDRGYGLFAEQVVGSKSPRFSADEPGNRGRKGVVPHFFTRVRAGREDHIERRLAWHAFDCTTPLRAELKNSLENDATVVMRSVEAVCSGPAGVDQDPDLVYALTLNPGHHAAYEHYGGYCFVNWASFAVELLCEREKSAFVIDVDYHAGDGTAEMLLSRNPRSFVSLHAGNDYPNVSPNLDWAITVPPRVTWDQYEPLLRTALSRAPNSIDILILCLGWDTLDGDPVCAESERMRLKPRDFGNMRRVLGEFQRERGGIPVLVIQEGGYKLEDIPDAAVEFWRGLDEGVV